jgi:hypothetical protein
LAVFERLIGPSLSRYHGYPERLKTGTSQRIESRSTRLAGGHITYYVATKDGKGSDLAINFNPGICGDAGGLGLSGAGWSSDEVLFHELVHAMSSIEGTDTTFAAPFLVLWGT